MALPFINVHSELGSIVLNLVFAYIVSCLIVEGWSLKWPIIIILMVYIILPKVSTYYEGNLGGYKYTYCDCRGYVLNAGYCCHSNVRYCIGLCRREAESDCWHIKWGGLSPGCNTWKLTSDGNFTITLTNKFKDPVRINNYVLNDTLDPAICLGKDYSNTGWINPGEIISLTASECTLKIPDTLYNVWLTIDYTISMDGVNVLKKQSGKIRGMVEE